ncbi:MAG: hypothetical protein GT601_06640 [Acidaminobacter sp.]|uniref:chloride channel protein n=1 Tax=Acidaminobacter sp. TaxID=1872102 RepID=UPI00137F6777|nr:chloride channel protein [Acidaminobacter sp.]MZQ97335.1 hypothetical protein [Acidaminobacter sp.]
MKVSFAVWRQWVIAGILIGLSISLFKMLLLDWDVFKRLTTGEPLVYFGALVLSALMMQYFKQRYPMIRGSGCPQLKGVLINRLEMRPETELPLKFGSVVLMNGIGVSVGSAGPAVQIGAYLGQLILKGRKDNDFLLNCAMASFAVLYGIPFAAVAFSVEEYQMKLKLEQLLSLAVVMSAALGIRFWLFGFSPTLQFSMDRYPGWQGTVLLFAMALTIGIMFKYGLLWTGKLFVWKSMILLPFVLTFYFSTRLPQILGGGIELFSFMEDQSSSILFETAVILLLGKFVFSLLCLSSGVPAGVFLPTLAIGGILGSVTALYSLEYLSESVLAYNSYVVLGIALICTAIFRRPFTAALLAVELTGNFGWLPYILLLAIVMNCLLKQFGDRPLNEILLEKLLDEDLNIDY